MIKKVLTIAGSDCSGGAGIQADLKTMEAHSVFGMSVVTAIVAENTQVVTSIQDVKPEIIADQCDCVFQDIYPDAVKVGMVSSPEIVDVIVRKLTEYKMKSIVVDPVMVATSGGSLIKTEAIEALVAKLFPLATIITPNIQEAELLAGMSIKSKADMVEAAKIIAGFYSGAVLIKGGHLEDSSDDLLYTDSEVFWFEGKRIDNPNTHGTGCTLSSAIACNLAKGFSVSEAVANAKQYISGAIAAKLDIGGGKGPLLHGYQKR